MVTLIHLSVSSKIQKSNGKRKICCKPSSPAMVIFDVWLYLLHISRAMLTVEFFFCNFKKQPMNNKEIFNAQNPTCFIDISFGNKICIACLPSLLWKVSILISSVYCYIGFDIFEYFTKFHTLKFNVNEY